MSHVRHTRYRVGGFTLDLKERCLRRNCDGERIHIRNRTYQLLVLLASKRNELVEHHDIFDTVWKDRYVTVDSLSQCIRELRIALQDDQKTILQTVHCSGYRLICEIVQNNSIDIDESVISGCAVPDGFSRNLSSVWQWQSDTSVSIVGYHINGIPCNLP